MSNDPLSDLRLAFHNQPKGKGPTLREAEVIRTSGPDSPKRAGVRRLDNDFRWWQISDAMFPRYDRVFDHLDDDGLAYYLPAYLTWYYKYPEAAAGSSAVENLAKALILPTAWETVDRMKKRFTVLNREQSEVVARWLQAVAEGAHAGAAEAARTALESYWGSFLG